MTDARLHRYPALLLCGLVTTSCRADEPSSASASATGALQECSPEQLDDCFDKAKRYRDGTTDSPKDPARAASLFGFACDHDSLDACYQLALLLSTPETPTCDLKKAVATLEPLCAKDIYNACTALGRILHEGIGGTSERERAVALFRNSCTHNDMVACRNLGIAHRLGQGVPKDFKEAARLFATACKGGDQGGCDSFGYAFASGEGPEKDLKAAAAIWIESCKHGYAHACYNLAGLLISEQPGVERDEPLARHFFDMACKDGERKACKWLETHPE